MKREETIRQINDINKEIKSYEFLISELNSKLFTRPSNQKVFLEAIPNVKKINIISKWLSWGGEEATVHKFELPRDVLFLILSYSEQQIGRLKGHLNMYIKCEE